LAESPSPPSSSFGVSASSSFGVSASSSFGVSASSSFSVSVSSVSFFAGNVSGLSDIAF
jgi:hypothetical protein